MAPATRRGLALLRAIRSGAPAPRPRTTPRPAVEELEPRLPPTTSATFDGAGSPYVLTQWQNPPAPAILPGGPWGKFLRLASLPAKFPNHNALTFGLTDPGRFALVVADFDFRITASAGHAPADG